MINIQADKKLALILPNTNKALAEVIKNASPSQLKELTQKYSDVKDVLSSLFDKSINTKESDKVVLDILKKSTIFKDMGSFSKDITTLQSLSKQLDIPKNIQEALTKFIKNMDTLDTKSLKNQISNSGIFLESKLSEKVDATEPLKSILKDLQTLLSKSITQESKQLDTVVKDIFKKLETMVSANDTKNTTENTKVLQDVSKSVQKIVSLLDTLHVNSDILHSKAVDKVVDNLQEIAGSDKTIKIQDISNQLQSLYSLVLQSKRPESSSILNSIEKLVSILNKIEDVTLLPKSEPQVSKELQKIVDTLHVSVKKDDVTVSKEMHQLKDKLSVFVKPEVLSSKHMISEKIVHDMKANILHLSEEIKQTPSLQNSDMAKIVDKLSLQIDYYQLYSHLNNSSSLYFPFVWDELEDGSLSVKKSRDKKFYCEINLNLKEYGELRVMLSLYDKNQINIHSFSQSAELKERLRENISDLRSAFIEADLTLREVRFFDKQDSTKSAYGDSESGVDMGFEVKV
jgi:hypothetical protein